MSRDKGLTYLELMIVLVIAVIITLFAYPAYNRHIQKTYRSEAIAALMDEAGRQERLYNLQRTLTPREPYMKASERYLITVQLNDPAFGYILRAIPQGPQEDDACGTLILTHLGSRQTTRGDAHQCWHGGSGQ